MWRKTAEVDRGREIGNQQSETGKIHQGASMLQGPRLHRRRSECKGGRNNRVRSEPCGAHPRHALNLIPSHFISTPSKYGITLNKRQHATRECWHEARAWPTAVATSVRPQRPSLFRRNRKWLPRHQNDAKMYDQLVRYTSR